MEKGPLPAPDLPAAALAACEEPRTSPSGTKSRSEKEETLLPPGTSPMPSSGADPGLSGKPMASGGSAARRQDLRLPKRRPPVKRYRCTSDGCRLACPNMKDLLEHLRVHYCPTQSLEGKTFRCSTLGCLESFPNMQTLMGHMKAHYKPNRFFKCENCLSRFRTHRSLFKHLHSCSDSAAAAPPTAPSPSQAFVAEKPVLPTACGLEKEPLGQLLGEELAKLQGVTQHLQKEALLPGTMEAALPLDSLPASLPGLFEPLPLTHPYPLVEQSLFGPAALARCSGPAHSAVPGAFLPYMHPANDPFPQAAAVQNRLRAFLPSQGLPVSNAVWKKSQGHSSNSRIVWEHTRGRYSCLQCPYSTASREEVTQHIEDHRKNPSPPTRLEGEMDFGVQLPSFHPKLTPDMENSLFTTL